MTLDFGSPDVSRGAAIVLRVKGFIPGEGPDRAYSGTPAVVVEIPAGNGQWQEAGRLLPRFEYSVAAFDLGPYVQAGSPVVVRLRSVSHSVKYHSIDFVALQAGASAPFNANLVRPTSAVAGAADVLPKLSSADGSYVELSPGQAFTLAFPELPLDAGQVRDFIFISKGYYVPKSGTYLLYTKEGSDWVLRDAFISSQTRLTPALVTPSA